MFFCSHTVAAILSIPPTTALHIYLQHWQLSQPLPLPNFACDRIIAVFSISITPTEPHCFPATILLLLSQFHSLPQFCCDHTAAVISISLTPTVFLQPYCCCYLNFTHSHSFAATTMLLLSKPPSPTLHVYLQLYCCYHLIPSHSQCLSAPVVLLLSQSYRLSATVLLLLSQSLLTPPVYLQPHCC